MRRSEDLAKFRRMFYRRDKEPLPRHGRHLIILVLLIAGVLLGVALMLLGGEVWNNAALSRAGSWLAGASGLLYLFIRWLGHRNARHRRSDGDGKGRAR